MIKDILITCVWFLFSTMLGVIFISYFRREGIEPYRYVTTFVVMFYFGITGFLSLLDIKKKHFRSKEEETDYSIHLVEK
jgi:hypothetical protein